MERWGVNRQLCERNVRELQLSACKHEWESNSRMSCEKYERHRSSFFLPFRSLHQRCWLFCCAAESSGALHRFVRALWRESKEAVLRLGAAAELVAWSEAGDGSRISDSDQPFGGSSTRFRKPQASIPELG